jgi:hypothetical protein
MTLETMVVLVEVVQVELVLMQEQVIHPLYLRLKVFLVAHQLLLL